MGTYVAAERATPEYTARQVSSGTSTTAIVNQKRRILNHSLSHTVIKLIAIWTILTCQLMLWSKF